MRTKRLILTAAVAAALTAGGCKSRTKSVSDSEYMLGLLHEAWPSARESLNASDPQLGKLHSVYIILVQRLPRRVEKDYTRSDKAQVVAKVNSLAQGYDSQVWAKVEIVGSAVRLKAGFTVEQVREAFMKLDAQYRELEAMTGN